MTSWLSWIPLALWVTLVLLIHSLVLLRVILALKRWVEVWPLVPIGGVIHPSHEGLVLSRVHVVVLGCGKDAILLHIPVCFTDLLLFIDVVLELLFLV